MGNNVSIRSVRLCIFLISRPMHLPAGAEPGCLPKRNGNTLPRAWTTAMPRVFIRNRPLPNGTACMACSVPPGSGRAAAMRHIPDSSLRLAPLASTTENSWSTSMFCVARPVRRLQATRAQRTVISSRLTRSGSLPAFALPDRERRRKHGLSPNDSADIHRATGAVMAVARFLKSFPIVKNLMHVMRPPTGAGQAVSFWYSTPRCACAGMNRVCTAAFISDQSAHSLQTNGYQ